MRPVWETVRNYYKQTNQFSRKLAPGWQSWEHAVLIQARGLREAWRLWCGSLPGPLYPQSLLDRLACNWIKKILTK